MGVWLGLMYGRNQRNEFGSLTFFVNLLMNFMLSDAIPLIW